MNWQMLQNILLIIQHGISCIGIIIILSGVLIATYHYIRFMCIGFVGDKGTVINAIRLDLGRVLILGLEFIVAADLISTTTTPDYYSVGITAIVVAIRTLLSFSLNREIASLTQEQGIIK